MTVSIFGHRDASYEVCHSKALENALEGLIEQGATVFYIGNHGNFDRCAYSLLDQLQNKYRDICVFVVLAYMPHEKKGDYTKEVNTLFPEGMECVPYKAAIPKRNEWMIKHSDWVFAYMTRSGGGVGVAVRKAVALGKRVILFRHGMGDEGGARLAIEEEDGSRQHRGKGRPQEIRDLQKSGRAGDLGVIIDGAAHQQKKQKHPQRSEEEGAHSKENQAPGEIDKQADPKEGETVTGGDGCLLSVGVDQCRANAHQDIKCCPNKRK